MEHLTPEEFDTNVLKSNNKIIVLFYATWCPYCSNFKPTFESAKTDAVKMGAIIDEDENPLWDKFQIEAVPTMIAFQNGRIIARKDAKKNIGLTKSDMDLIINNLS